MTEGGKNAQKLIITDCFMRYTHALVISSQTAKCTAQALWDQFVVHDGIPESIVSEQGRNFKSGLILELLKLTKVQKLCTSPYHPQTNGQCEQFNHTFINILGTLPLHKKSSWRDMVPVLVHAYNCTRSTAMGLSPYYVMYGQNPHFLSICILVPKEQTWMPLQVPNLYNNCGRDWSGHVKLPIIS